MRRLRRLFENFMLLHQIVKLVRLEKLKNLNSSFILFSSGTYQDKNDSRNAFQTALVEYLKRVVQSEKLEDDSAIFETLNQMFEQFWIPKDQVLKSFDPVNAFGPFNYIEGKEVPNNILERDILHVASQMVYQFKEDLPVQFNKLTARVIDIATKLKNRKFSTVEAIQTIRRIFSAQPCIPLDFLNTFIYHVNNEYFSGVTFMEPEQNAYIRSMTLNLKRKVKCEEQIQENAEGIAPSTAVADLSDENLKSLANKAVEPKSPQKQLEAVLGDVTMVGVEPSNNDENMLAVPVQVNLVETHDIAVGYERTAEVLPPANVASVVIDQEVVEVDNRLNQQEQTINNLQNTNIINYQYVLRPESLKTQNFWHVRGSEIPDWFPGLITVFADSYNFTPTCVLSPDAAIFHAWSTMIPSAASKF